MCGDMIQDIKKDHEITNDLMELVCFYFSITKKKMISDCRDNECKFARFFYCLFRKALYDTGLRIIGIEIGEKDDPRDHTTVLHGINRITELICINDKYVTKCYEELLGILNDNGFDFVKVRKYVANKCLERMNK